MSVSVIAKKNGTEKSGCLGSGTGREDASQSVFSEEGYSDQDSNISNISSISYNSSNRNASCTSGSGEKGSYEFFLQRNNSVGVSNTHESPTESFYT